MDAGSKAGACPEETGLKLEFFSPGASVNLFPKSIYKEKFSIHSHNFYVKYEI